MKKSIMSNFRKFLSVICSLAIVLGVSIPALSVSVSAASADKNNKPFDEVYNYPSIGEQNGAVYDFNDADEYVVTNQENAIYHSYHQKGAKPSGQTIAINNGKLELSSGITSGTASVQSWVINKNGVPYELIPGHSYTVYFDFGKEGEGFTNSNVYPYIALGNGVANNDWTMLAEYDGEDYWFGSSASVMEASTDGTKYSYKINNDLYNNTDYPNFALKLNGSDNKIVQGYKGYPSSKTYEKSFVAYDVTNGGSNSRTKNYLTFLFALKPGQKFIIDNIKVCDNTSGTVFITYNNGDGTSEVVAHKAGDEITKSVTAPSGYVHRGWKSTDGKTIYTTVPDSPITLDPHFVLASDTLTDENSSITYDFSNASEYVLINGSDDYYSFAYGYPASGILPENGLSVANGSLVLKSGLDNVDCSSVSSDSSKRSISTWVINKNGKPFEFVPGVDYKISVKLKNYTSGAGKSFISISNGIAMDDINGTWWWSNFGANASVMPAKSGTTYSYEKKNVALNWSSAYGYAANAVYSWNDQYNKNFTNNYLVTTADNNKNIVSISDGTYTKEFQAYDITDGGTNVKRRNYLALTFCLCQGQSVEIEEITISYDYSKLTNVTYNYADGTTKTVVERIGNDFTETDTKANCTFEGWKDSEGNLHTTVPQVSGGSIELYSFFSNNSIVLDDETQNKITFDFNNPDEYQLVNTDEVANKYISAYLAATATNLRPGIKEAQKKGETIQIGADGNNSVLKLSSGIPADTDGVTIQSFVLNKNGRPLELEPGSYYKISIKLKEANKPGFTREKSFVSISNGIAFDDKSVWSEFGASASVKGEGTFTYTTGQTHDKTTSYPNNAIGLYNENYNAIVWANEDSDFSSDYTTYQNTYLGYDITENGTKNRKNYLALTFALRSGQEIYVDSISVTKVYKLSFETYEHNSISNKYEPYGTQITLPVPTISDDEQFIAWTNEDTTVSYDNIFTMPATNTKLYALYDALEVAVDPYMYEIMDSSVNIEYDSDDNFSVVSGSSSAKLALPNGTGAGNYAVANGRKYKITFDYLLNGNDNEAYINAFTAKLSEPTYKETNSYAFRATSSENWQSGELTVILDPDGYLADGQHAIANALFLGIYGLDSSAECKFANIVITVLDEAVLTVNYNLGDNKVQHTTNDGMSEIAEPEKDGFVFGGWYDSLSQEAFTFGAISEDTTVYADWITEYVVGDVNYDGEFDARDLVRLKKIAVEMYDDEIINKRGEINSDYSYAQNLILLRNILLTDTLPNEIQKTIRIAGIDIANYCVEYADGTNVLLNEAVASLETTLGNPATNDTFKIIITSDSNANDGIYVDGVNLVVNSASGDKLISYVNQLARTINRYDGKYHLGFNEDLNYGEDLSKNDYAITFCDEFDSDVLSNSWSTPVKTGVGAYKDANGETVSTFVTSNGENIALRNGVAVLNASVVDENGDNIPESFKSQSINSNISFTYGYLEARIKIAANPATSTFWLDGTQYSPVTGRFAEYDIFETLGKGSDNDHILYSNVHSWGKNEHYSLDDADSESNKHNSWWNEWMNLDKSYESETAFSEDYHVFAAKWDEDSITYYIDGKEYFTYTFDGSYLDEVVGGNLNTFRQPVSIKFSCGMGESNYGPLWAIGDLASSNVEIDYVRLYQSEIDGGNLNGLVSEKYEKYNEEDWRLHPEDYKLIAFTFDDAPNYTGYNNYTTSMIDTMNKYHGAGTLFIVGKKIDQYGCDTLQYAIDRGFELGNHTYSHKSVYSDADAKNWSAEENLSDFKLCQDAIYDKLGIPMKWFRPAELSTNKALYDATTEMGLPVIGKSVATKDYDNSVTAQEVKDAVLQNASDGGIVLMHCWAKSTYQALDEICEELYNDGYRFCTLSELFEFKGIDYNQLPCDKIINSTSY